MPGQKLNNRSLYPDANHQPRHLAAFRKKDALERQAAYDLLTLEQKLARLPPEPFSKKQRNKLLVLLEKKNQAPVAKEVAPKVEIAEDKNVQKQTKKYTKGQ